MTRATIRLKKWALTSLSSRNTLLLLPTGLFCNPPPTQERDKQSSTTGSSSSDRKLSNAPGRPPRGMMHVGPFHRKIERAGDLEPSKRLQRLFPCYVAISCSDGASDDVRRWRWLVDVDSKPFMRMNG